MRKNQCDTGLIFFILSNGTVVEKGVKSDTWFFFVCLFGIFCFVFLL